MERPGTHAMPGGCLVSPPQPPNVKPTPIASAQARKIPKITGR